MARHCSIALVVFNQDNDQMSIYISESLADAAERYVDGALTIHVEVTCGSAIENACEDAIALAFSKQEEHGEPVIVTFDFNGVAMRAESYGNADVLVAYYNEQMDAQAEESRRKRAEWERSPEGKAELARLQKEHDEFVAARNDALAKAPAEPTWSDPEGFAKAKEVNSDGYGGAVISFMVDWARLIEGEMSSGVALKDCVKRCERFADYEVGITGFMYGCAVSFLSQCWAHGDELRRWHNLDTQIGDEGEKANENGGVLNPALLSIG